MTTYIYIYIYICNINGTIRPTLRILLFLEIWIVIKEVGVGNILIVSIYIVEVRLIDKTQGSDPTKREHYWMRTLKTLYPDGLNIESDY